MARCSCSGSTGCSCRLVEGGGILISGSGTAADPFVITAEVTSFASSFTVQDTDTVNLSLVGQGTPTDPFILTGNSAIAMTQLSDWDDPAGPAVGEVPVWNGAAWEAAAPPTVPPGAVNTGPGLLGDGSALTPLEVAVSDTVSTSTSGTAIYVDSAGELRAVPGAAGEVAWADITDKPTSFPSTWSDVSGKPTSFAPIIGPGSTQAAAGDHTHALTGSSLTGTLPISKGGTGGTTVSTAQVALNVMDISTINSAFAFRDANINTNAVNINTLAAGAVAGKANAIDDVNQAVYARGSAQPHAGSVVGAGPYYAVWVCGADQGYRFARNTSSRRFKQDIVPVTVDVAKVLSLQPVTYDRIGGEPTREFGLIAEDVYEAGLTEIVTWYAEPITEEVDEPYEEFVTSEDGTSSIVTKTHRVRRETGRFEEPVIDGLRYDLLAVALLDVVKTQQASIESLERKHTGVLARLRTLEGSES